MPKTKNPEPDQNVNVNVNDLAAAFREGMKAAVEESRPRAITVANRKKNTPWTPKDGSPKLKFKRKTYVHGLLCDEAIHSNEEIALANKVRPGVYGDGYIKVIRRRDKGIDIDWPVRTAAQRLKLVNTFGIRNFAELLQFCINEAANPKPQVEDLD